jgi:3-deoxy-D-manno-octulosonate 8-phosphate phosphatase (KDO 8-P phosphatase)
VTTRPSVDPELARRIRVVILDADGVLTDGGIYVADGEGTPFEARRFHVHDGVGILMLRHAGIVVAVVSGKLSRAVRARAADLGLEEVHQVDPYHKLPTVEALLERAGASWDETAFLADDLADLGVLGEVGLPAAVPDAAPEVLATAAWTGTRAGGSGVVREFAEALLHARGEWTPLVEAYVEECRRRWRDGDGG